MNKIKRFISCLLSSFMVVSIVSFSSIAVDEHITGASDKSSQSEPILQIDVVPVPITCYNEIEEILIMREATPQELEKLGISQKEADDIATIDIEKAYYERAQLPESQLRAYGYTDEQIAILKEYDGSTITSDSPIVAVSATCVGSASKVSASTSKIAFQYTWTWSNMPVIMGTDKIGICWQEYNANSVAIDADNSQSTYVKYYWTTSGAYDSIQTVSTPVANNFAGCSADIVMEYFKTQSDGNLGAIWAKSGTTTVSLSKSRSDISYIKFAGSYGHRTLTFSEGISVSSSAFSLSFAPAAKVSKLATVNRKITSSGSMTSFHNIKEKERYNYMGTQIMSFVAYIGLTYLSPFAGFAIVDILNCIRTNKPFWLPSKIIAIAFICALGWGVGLAMIY